MYSILYIYYLQTIFAKQYFIMMFVTFKLHHTLNNEGYQIEACKT